MEIAGVHVTDAQMARIVADEKALQARRAAAGRRAILAAEARDQGVNCAGCVHLGDFNAEHRRGWCMHLKHMVATWLRCECRAFQADR